MSVPVLYQVTAFPSTTEKVFNFSWNGFQCVKNKLKIRNNATNAVVYEEIIETFQLKHTLPENSLTNGILYNAEIYAINSSDVLSSPSAKILFWCFEEPTFEFSNLVPDQIITNSSYGVELNYEQTEGELLNQYQVSLYNSAQSLLYQTGILYNTENLTATIFGLNDNTQYYVRATGKTLNGMDLDTGYIRISVEYLSPALFSLVELENMPRDGNIKITSNFISIAGKSLPDPPNYLDDSWVDLSTDGLKVWFDEGFNIVNNFILQIIGKNFNDYSTILELSNNVHKIELNTARGTFTSIGSEKWYLVLKVYNNITNYMLTSNYIDVPSDDDQISVWIRRINNIYELHIENLGI